jgi:hypothetical protein
LISGAAVSQGSLSILTGSFGEKTQIFVAACGNYI